MLSGTEECIADKRALLSERLASAARIEGTRDYHKFILIKHLCFYFHCINKYIKQNLSTCNRSGVQKMCERANEVQGKF